MHAPSPAPIADLLRALFDANELRIHLAREPDGIALVDALPGNAASYEALAHEAAVALVRRGLVSPGLFERLAAARPNRQADIRRVCDAWFAGPRPTAQELWCGRYRLDAQVGDGGFGTVWRAVDERTGQYVALKILHAVHHANARVRTRFFRGAQTLAGLSHPAIVRVLGVSEAGPNFFYAMEYVRGVTLDVCVRERRYPTDTLLALVLQIGDALVHVHRHGLLHRDIKPSNIIVTAPERAVLIDFDLVTGDDYVALTTEAIGTGLYMPPEAYTSDRKTGAYDVFSLARTVEFVLRGREPTARELSDVADLPASAAIRGILRAALQPDPQLRIPEMSIFCALLRDADSPVAPASPDEAPERLDPESGHRYAAIASVVGHFVALVFLAPVSEKTLPLLAVLTLPSLRVLTGFLPGRSFDILHWIWSGLLLVLMFLFTVALCDTRGTSNVRGAPLVVLIAALAAGAFASYTYLRRSSTVEA